MEQREQGPQSSPEATREDSQMERARAEFVANAKARFDARARAAAEATQRLGLPDEAMMDVFSVMYGDGNPITPHEEQTTPQHEEGSHE